MIAKLSGIWMDGAPDEGILCARYGRVRPSRHYSQYLAYFLHAPVTHRYDAASQYGEVP